MERLSLSWIFPKRLLRAAILPISAVLATATLCSSVVAQEALERGEVEPMGEWAEFHQMRFVFAPILLHLRTGYERAVLMPEPVELQGANDTLPGSEIVIDEEVVGFYPTINFSQHTLILVGLSSGTVYELSVKASPTGTRQPVQISR